MACLQCEAVRQGLKETFTQTLKFIYYFSLHVYGKSGEVSFAQNLVEHYSKTALQHSP